jgi:hypothetical protein
MVNYSKGITVMDVQDRMIVEDVITESSYNFDYWIRHRDLTGIDYYDREQIRKAVERAKGYLDSCMMIVGEW